MSYFGLGATGEGTLRTQNGVTYVWKNGAWRRARATDIVPNAPVYQPPATREAKCKPGTQRVDARGGVSRSMVCMADGTWAASDTRGRPLFDYCDKAKVPQDQWVPCMQALAPLVRESDKTIKKAAEEFAKSLKEQAKADEQAAQMAPVEAPKSKLPLILVAVGGVAVLGVVFMKSKKKAAGAAA